MDKIKKQSTFTILPESPITSDDESISWNEQDLTKAGKIKKLTKCLDLIKQEQFPAFEDAVMNNQKVVEDVVKQLRRTLRSDNFWNYLLRKKRFANDDVMRIDAIKSNEFEVRLFLEEFLYPNTFEILSGINENIPYGYISFKISDELTRQEKLVIYSQYAWLINEKDFLSSWKISTLLIEAIDRIIADAPPELASIQSYDINEDGTINLNLFDTTTPLVVKIFTSILGRGLRKGMRLQHVFPRQRPLSDLGRRHLENIEAKIEDGQYIWYADCKKCDAKLLKWMRPPPFDSMWTLSFDPLIREFEQHSNQIRPLIEVEDINRYFKLLQQNNTPLKRLSNDFIRTVALLQVKKGKRENEKAKRFLDYLNLMSMYLKLKCCPNFLVPNLNILESMQEVDIADAAETLSEIINDILAAPGKLLVYSGYDRSVSANQYSHSDLLCRRVSRMDPEMRSDRSEAGSTTKSEVTITDEGSDTAPDNFSSVSQQYNYNDDDEDLNYGEINAKEIELRTTLRSRSNSNNSTDSKKSRSVELKISKIKACSNLSRSGEDVSRSTLMRSKSKIASVAKKNSGENSDDHATKHEFGQNKCRISHESLNKGIFKLTEEATPVILWVPDVYSENCSQGGPSRRSAPL